MGNDPFASLASLSCKNKAINIHSLLRAHWRYILFFEDYTSFVVSLFITINNQFTNLIKFFLHFGCFVILCFYVKWTSIWPACILCGAPKLDFYILQIVNKCQCLNCQDVLIKNKTSVVGAFVIFTMIKSSS